jgi:hypothetical protein
MVFEKRVKDRGEAGPIGHPDLYSIEQTPADKDHILLKDGLAPKAACPCEPARPWGGSTSVFEWRLPLETPLALGPAQFRPPWSPCHTI